MSTQTQSQTQSKTKNNPPKMAQNEKENPTIFQISLGLLIIGASAGMTLYTKKTAAILSQMKQVEKNREMRLPKKIQMYGPLNREDWERVRNRWDDKDDI
eukprot:211483_1